MPVPSLLFYSDNYPYNYELRCLNCNASISIAGGPVYCPYCGIQFTNCLLKKEKIQIPRVPLKGMTFGIRIKECWDGKEQPYNKWNVVFTHKVILNEWMELKRENDHILKVLKRELDDARDGLVGEDYILVQLVNMNHFQPIIEYRVTENYTLRKIIGR